MKRLCQFITSFAIAATLSIAGSGAVMAQSMQAGANAAHGSGQPTELFGPTSIFTSIVNLMLFVIGAIAVIMIVYGGLRYVTSGGNAANVTTAKNTILYAIVGIVVAIVAYAAVNFVITSLAAGGGTSGL